MRRNFLRQLSRGALAAALGSTLALALPTARAQENFRIMIGANPGGGYDQTGRGLGRALQEAGVAGSVTYENKGGAGGTIGLAQFVNASKGDPNALVVVGVVMVGAIVQNKPPITMSQATPIARLLAEYNVFVVPAGSPIKSMRDVVEQMKKDPASVKWGGGSKGSVDHVSVAMIAREVGVDVAKVNYVPFKGGGEATAAILGGHVTVGTSGYAEMEEFIKSGKMRALAVTAPNRLRGSNVPTLVEQGIDVTIGNWRGVYGAPGITPEQRKKLTDAVTKATRTKAWSETLSSNNWTPALLTGEDFSRFVDEEHARLRALMVKLGML
ncbi:MAG TPA: tripartite tricarboxylate transporter substrate-binding protein [Burkholderiaceae bacterium]|nr:tripartite tricarboxylate transporter substrate-binding protein [Burkholderiaceae bacterium]